MLINQNKHTTLQIGGSNLSEPIITKMGLGFQVSWNGEDLNADELGLSYITMKFHHFLDDKGDPRPEVKVTHSAKAHPLFDGRINLNSPTSKKSAVNRLADSTVDNIKWGQMVDSACSAVRDAKRTGEPIVDLSTLELNEGSKFAVEPFLLQKQANLFYGNGGLGKSWVSLYFAVLMAGGVTHEGFTPEPGRVLYLDYESDAQDMNARFKALCSGLGIKPPRFEYRRMTQSIPGDSERILEIVDERDIKLIIVDSAAPGSGGKPEEAATAIGFFNALNATGVTTLTIGHITKNDANEKGRGSPFGSIFWRNEPRNIWEIQQGNTYSKTVKEFGLFQTKFNSGAGEDPLGLRFTFDDPRTAKNVRVERIDVRSNDKLAQSVSWADKIRGVILKVRDTDNKRPFAGVTKDQILNEYGLDSTDRDVLNTLSKTLSQGKARGHFINPFTGQWDLVSESEQDKRVAQNEMEFGSQSEHFNR